jgi:putative ABC transport system permease protein
MHLLRAVRSLERNPVAPLLSVATMAVGIGLAAAMLSVLNGTLWHPLTFRSADRLVALHGPVSAETVGDWTAAARSFDGIAGYRTRRYTLTGSGDATSLRATVETGGLFDLLETPAASGRVLGIADARAGTLAVVVSDECWRSTFNADPALPGRSIYLNGLPFVVAGIAPAGFRFPVNTDRVDLYTTTAADLQADRRPAGGQHPRDLMVVGKLKASATLAAARAEMERLRSSDEPDPRRREERRASLVVPLASDVSAGVGSPIEALSWAVAGVVAISCVTAAILSLIRVTSRRAEWATRLAVGATGRDLVLQVLAESLLIAAAGGLVGAVVAVLVSQPLLVMAGPAVNAAARSRFDTRVWAWVAALTGVAAIAFGALPAALAARTRWSSAHDFSRAAGGSGSTARRWLVTAEIAAAVVILAASLSLLQAYEVLSKTDTGYRSSGAITFRVDLADARYSSRQQAEFFESLRTIAREVRGVTGAAFTALPPFGDLRFTIRFDEADAPGGSARRAGAEVHLVSPGYFRAMGMTMIDGREFAPSDGSDRDPVVIISQSAAARRFPGQPPVGRTLDVSLGPGGRLPTVVGVVNDIRNGSLTAPNDPQIYLPFAQLPMRPSTTFVVRTPDAGSAAVVSAIRQGLRRLDATVPLVDVRPLEEFVWNAASLPRFTTAVAGVFAAAAVFLAMAGLYAVVAYTALCRRREFSIRRALGATEEAIGRLVFRQCARLVIPGMGIGLAGAFALGRGLEGSLYGVHPRPWPTMAATVGTAAALAFLATWWPARAAGRDDLRSRLQSND